MKNFAAPLLGLAVMTGSTFAASAQTASEIELTRAEIQTARQAIIAEGMKLTDEEALAFWPDYRDYRVEMARLGDRIIAAGSRARSLGPSKKSGSGSAPWSTSTEPVLGTSFGDILPLFEKDPDTKGVAVFGEIGGPYDEEAAECVRKKDFTKPLVIFVAGAWAPEGMRFSHASSYRTGEGFGEEQDSNPEGSRCACGGSAR